MPASKRQKTKQAALQSHRQNFNFFTNASFDVIENNMLPYLSSAEQRTLYYALNKDWQRRLDILGASNKPQFSAFKFILPSWDTIFVTLKSAIEIQRLKTTSEKEYSPFFELFFSTHPGKKGWQELTMSLSKSMLYQLLTVVSAEKKGVKVGILGKDITPYPQMDWHSSLVYLHGQTNKNYTLIRTIANLNKHLEHHSPQYHGTLSDCTGYNRSFPFAVDPLHPQLLKNLSADQRRCVFDAYTVKYKHLFHPHSYYSKSLWPLYYSIVLGLPLEFERLFQEKHSEKKLKTIHDKESFLITAIYYGQVEIAKKMLHSNFINPNNIEKASRIKIPPLHLAAQQNNLEMVVLLLQYGANPLIISQKNKASDLVPTHSEIYTLLKHAEEGRVGVPEIAALPQAQNEEKEEAPPCTEVEDRLPFPPSPMDHEGGNAAPTAPTQHANFRPSEITALTLPFFQASRAVLPPLQATHSQEPTAVRYGNLEEDKAICARLNNNGFFNNLTSYPPSHTRGPICSSSNSSSSSSSNLSSSSNGSPTSFQLGDG